MLQRIQTLFLLLAFFLSSFAYFLQDDNLWLKSAYLLSSIFILGSVTQYKARKKQLKLVLFTIILQICYIIFLAIYLTYLSGGQTNFWSEKGIEFIYPLGVIVFLVLARSYILKDENLVKSLDRLR